MRQDVLCQPSLGTRLQYALSFYAVRCSVRKATIPFTHTLVLVFWCALPQPQTER